MSKALSREAAARKGCGTMSAVVRGKRSCSIFADELFPPSPPSPLTTTTTIRRPRGPAAPPPPREALLLQLIPLFPDMDPQLLEKALETSGDGLDFSAIKSLNELHLESTGFKPDNGQPRPTIQPSVEGVPNGGVEIAATEHPPALDNYQTTNNGSEWVELFVREMTNASDIDDAWARASRALQALEKSTVERAGAEGSQNLHN